MSKGVRTAGAALAASASITSLSSFGVFGLRLGAFVGGWVDRFRSDDERDAPPLGVRDSLAADFAVGLGRAARSSEIEL